MSNSKKFKVGSPVKIVGTVHNGVQGKIIKVLPVGSKSYVVDSHKKIPTTDHLNHAINHINEHRRGDESEMHLVNAMCRLLFAISGVLKTGYYEDTYWHPDMGPKHTDKLPKPVPGEKKNEA